MNTFLDNNNAIIPLAIGPGAAVFINPTDWLSFVVTASDADVQPFKFSFATAFEGKFFTYFETHLRLRLKGPRRPLVGNYRFGVLLDPRETTIPGGEPTGRQNRAFYVSFDQMVFRRGDESDQGLGLFFRYGWRPADLNPIGHFWSRGTAIQGSVWRPSA